MVQVVEVSVSKTGKHGHAKCSITAVDIFTGLSSDLIILFIDKSAGKKMETMSPSTHNIEVPVVNRTTYTLIDINKDNFATLLDENSETREDLAFVGDSYVSLLTRPFCVISFCALFAGPFGRGSPHSR